MGRMLYAKLIGRVAFFTCGNIAHIEFYLQGLLPKILAICTINNLSFIATTYTVYDKTILLNSVTVCHKI